MRTSAEQSEDEPSTGKRPSKAVRVAHQHGLGRIRRPPLSIVRDCRRNRRRGNRRRRIYVRLLHGHGGRPLPGTDAPFRFVNHSCEPNCRFKWFDITAQGDSSPQRRVFLLTLLEIEKGQQFTIDYRWPPAMAIPCRCGEATCRRWIVAEEDLQQLLLDIEAERQQKVAERQQRIADLQQVDAGRSQQVALSKT